ncbi:MAG: ribosome biogenesis GTPase RsgA [Gammaproteobacteria bacterium]|nr:ribosome biogenesis GTPase RsgA [Gammaproteobacteria bacterium]NND36658.1 ribosome biogenesis GTPase RsgA [Gammaproteobacteria bacterium]
MLLLLAGSLPAHAGSHGEPAVSLDEAIALVRDKSGGKVLRAETKGKNHKVVHEIRILTEDGHVRTYVVDGTTGKVK